MFALDADAHTLYMIKSPPRQRVKLRAGENDVIMYDPRPDVELFD